jgi:4-amino-4-deoxy-L-arabinose transferase-like glycosyltransferase
VVTVQEPRPSTASRLAEPRYAVPLLILFAALLRLPNLGESLWFDEVMYSTRIGTRSLQALWRSVTDSQHGPFYPAVLYLWTTLAGESEIMVRLPSMVCGIGSIVLAYLLARRHAGSRAAVVAALFLCLSPVHVWYSQEATPYAMALFLLLAAMYVQPWVAPSAAGMGWAALYVLLLSAAVLCHAYTAVFLLPLTLAALRLPRRAAAVLLGANVGVGLLLAALLAAKYQSGHFQFGLGFARPFTLGEWWMLFFSYFLQGHAIWSARVFRAASTDAALVTAVLAVQLAAAALVLRGLLSKGNGARRPRWELAAYLLVLPIVLLALTTFGARRMYIERYLFVVLPFFAIVLARGALSTKRAAVNAVLTGSVLAVALGSYAMWLQKDAVWTVYKPNPDWQSTVQYLRPRIADPNRTAVFGTVPLHDLVFYLRRAMPDGAPRVATFNRRRLDRALNRHRVTTVHLVHNRFWGGRFERVLARVQDDPRLHLTGTRSFKGVSLYTFERRPPPGPEGDGR